MPDFESERSILAQQIRQRLEPIRNSVYLPRRPIGPMEAVSMGSGRGPEPVPADGWAPFALRDRWGGVDQTVWFRMRATVPPEMDGQRVVALICPHQGNHGNSLVYVNGVPRQGLDKNRDEVLLAERAKAGDTFEIVLEAVAAPECDNRHDFLYADIAVMHPLPWEFYWDVQVPLEVYEFLPKNYAPRQALLRLLNAAVKMVDLRHIGGPGYHDSLQTAQQYLREGLKAFALSNDMGRMAVIGHSHIDTAWMWPIRETRRKIGRTTSTILALMERYPDFTFSHSQPIQYEYLEEDYPQLYAQVKQRIAEGRWDPAGALFVECDMNVTGGESIVRQVLHGVRWYERAFNKRPRFAWVPDCFGFTWSLPQILRRAGIENFSTSKLSWNEYTTFPYSAFHWEGTDGTRIPVMSFLRYGSVMRTRELFEQYEAFAQKDLCEEIPYTVGWGDGGGGPTPEMIEKTRRLKNLVGVPRCEFDTLSNYFARMESVCNLDALPVYNDELYLEFHRACQITQARTKRFNRLCELGLRDVELLSARAMLAGASYPADAIHAAWKPVLINQFHDILPGSSITEVYTVAEREYAEVLTQLDGLRSDATARLAHRIDTTGEGVPLIVWNTLSRDRNGLVLADRPALDGPFHVVDSSGTPVAHQETADGQILIHAPNVPSLGHAVFRALPGAASVVTPALTVSATGAENPALCIEWDESGRLTRVYDKECRREVLAPGAAGNVLQLFDDRPHRSDAWDIDFDFEDIQWEPGPCEEIEIREAGPLRAVARFIRHTEQSVITQDLIVYAHSRRIDMATHVDWHEKHTLLKVAFPVDIRAAHATYEIQFGTIQRATHQNTEYDRARFEVPAQRWADLSEGNYGVSLLNDCKYGYDVRGNQLRLSLLRAPSHPDPDADQGSHDFTYSLYPHPDDWRTGTVREAAELNTPLRACWTESAPGALPAREGFAAVEATNVIIDTVKRAEDSDDIIVRLYEAYGCRGDVTLTFSQPPAAVFECDLMEENNVPVELDGSGISIYVTPYQIRTFRLRS